MDYSKLRPLHGIIVIKLDTEEVSSGGIVLVKIKGLDYGTVVAVGPGEWVQEPNKTMRFREVGVSPGDRIVISPGAGVVLETTIDDETELLTYLSENDIVSLIHE